MGFNNNYHIVTEGGRLRGSITQSKWTKGSILTKIIGTYKSEMPGNSAGKYVTLHEFHSLLICNDVK